MRLHTPTPQRSFRLLLALLAELVSLPVWADGKVFPPVATPAEVTIPDQRALISWANGMERLIIETRLAGSGTNFAWVVPLPSRPTVEPATSGLFPTLAGKNQGTGHLFRGRAPDYVPNGDLSALARPCR